MPIYEYKCKKCDCDFEMLVSMSDDKHVTCPKCGTNDVQRLLSRICLGGSRTGSCSPGSFGGFS